jgi:endoglucanase
MHRQKRVVSQMIKNTFSLLIVLAMLSGAEPRPFAWIRINLLGYKPGSVKVAVFGSKEKPSLGSFTVIDASTRKTVHKSKLVRSYGPYGPFTHTYRLDFSLLSTPGSYYVEANGIRSPVFRIDDHVYDGLAEFCLRYMRQQRSGYNPYLKDSCHTQDGYTMYGPMPDSTHLDVSGGWHDATDYLQYSMTSANAAYHLLAAWRDFPLVFGDMHTANGLTGANSVADVLDEARWGLDWLLKMHPQPDWMFNQLADDRDHAGFRLPTDDVANYGKGKERPVYFLTGRPQGLGKYKNQTNGTSSTAAKFSSAFAAGSQVFEKTDPQYAALLRQRAFSAYEYALRKPGNTQTACYREPYFYEETNWVDDMELALAELAGISGRKTYAAQSLGFARQEKHTPWLGQDTASHYQWYPFINLGHHALARLADPASSKEVIQYYKEGIELVLAKGKNNAFLRGVPFIWCSNNLQTSFGIQCYWYRQLSGDDTYAELEQATFDWLLGCNPWGTSMIVGYPENGDFPDDPHSSLNYLHGFQTSGGLVDGPVYGSIYKKQLGIRINRGDEYEAFQSAFVVYHDDYGDYVTNEPTMDGTASLIYLAAAFQQDLRGFNAGREKKK